MKTVKKNVYYCDYCDKRMLSASSMSVHEKHCTANPHRECRLCNNRLDIASYIEKLKARFKIKEVETDFEGTQHDIEWTGKPITVAEILKFADGCPNCTFAILRQTKLNYKVFGFDYDYHKEVTAWWKAINDEELEKEARGYYY